MTFIQQFERDNADIIKDLFEAPFMSQMIAGTLPKETFDFYVTQENAFLHDYLRSVGACMVKAHEEDLLFFTYLQDMIYQEIQAANALYTSAENFYFTEVVNTGYLNFSNFMLRTSYQEPVEVGLVMLFTLPYAYFHFMKFFTEKATPEHPYYIWLTINSVEKLQNLTDQLSGRLNEYAKNNVNLSVRMAETGRQALFYIYHFFQSCLDKEDFYDLPNLPNRAVF